MKRIIITMVAIFSLFSVVSGGFSEDMEIIIFYANYATMIHAFKPNFQALALI